MKDLHPQTPNLILDSYRELLYAQTMGAQLNTPDFLDWIADRLVNVYNESENIDFVLSLRARSKAGRKALATVAKVDNVNKVGT